jgi:hypothetical protein
MPRGGKRPGAGRKPEGITRKVSLTLTKEEWKQIEESGFPTLAAYLKHLLKNERLKDGSENEADNKESDGQQITAGQGTDQDPAPSKLNTLSPVELKIFWNQVTRGQQDPEVETYLRMDGVRVRFNQVILANNTVQGDRFICPITGRTFTDRKEIMTNFSWRKSSTRQKKSPSNGCKKMLKYRRLCLFCKVNPSPFSPPQTQENLH